MKSNADCFGYSYSFGIIVAFTSYGGDEAEPSPANILPNVPLVVSFTSIDS
jgi:hypothetical protein